jgi:hypothetical protein
VAGAGEGDPNNGADPDETGGDEAGAVTEASEGDAGVGRIRDAAV